MSSASFRSQEDPLLGPRKRKGAYNLNALVRKVRIDDVLGDEDKGDGLKRVLSVWELIAYGVASTVGRLPSSKMQVQKCISIQCYDTTSDQDLNSHKNAFFSLVGPGIAVCFAIAGFASLLSALCYSEFAAAVPVAGSAYTFAYVALGELTGWLTHQRVGWNLTLEYAISASAVARGWAGYVVDGLQSAGVHVPEWVDDYPLTSFLSLSPLAASIVFACTLILLVGMKESARFNMVITVVNLLLILFVIVCGSFFVDVVHWKPFFPYGTDGVLRGVGTVFFSYIGFDSVSTLAGEVKNPSRDLPIGIVGTLGISTVLYIAVSLVVTGMVPYINMDPDAPLSQAFFSVGIRWAGFLISMGSVTTMTATTLVSLVGQPRVFYQMAKDGLLPPIFAKLNAQGVPMWGTVITGMMSGLIAFCLDISSLANMISIGTLLAFIIVCGGVLVQRFQKKSRAWFVPVLLLIYSLASLLFGISFSFFPQFHPWSYIACGVVLLASFAPFLFLPTVNLPVSFKCPLVPFVPCGGILLNIWFIVTLPLDSILRLLVWTVIGFAIYFGYGIRNSALRDKHTGLSVNNE